jgi:hypothetical protein
VPIDTQVRKPGGAYYGIRYQIPTSIVTPRVGLSLNLEWTWGHNTTVLKSVEGAFEVSLDLFDLD